MATATKTTLKEAVHIAIEKAKTFARERPGVRLRKLGMTTTRSGPPPYIPAHHWDALSHRESWHYIEVNYEGAPTQLLVISPDSGAVVVWVDASFSDWGL